MINALIHRDYTALGDIQVRVTEDAIDVWSPGGLLQGVTVASLRDEHHTSNPRNPLIARAFFLAGFIEHWGTGTTKMIRLCRDQGLPEPEYVERSGGFAVTFRKDIYTPERLMAIGLSERQVKVALHLKQQSGDIGNAEYRQTMGVSDRTATRDLSDLERKGILEQVGATGRGTRYRLKAATKPPKAP